ncbi:hypothetical protein CYMTET_4093 [Cymbomonas tetramitiformis]|uniref:Uncharacterized protein n=1 Tax=Cymbomonas tetramitiformis TaxID=36881 RepID=A0AAE0LK71_9CHLO|nr:hypothetical protein CYMTET_4093 [Cymbomonas tetramitiformis]
MTINKSQGQTLQHVGLYLPKPVFSHGQLYVAFSRATRLEGVTVLTEDDGDHQCADDTGVYTLNVVFPEALLPGTSDTVPLEVVFQEVDPAVNEEYDDEFPSPPQQSPIDPDEGRVLLDDGGDVAGHPVHIYY